MHIHTYIYIYTYTYAYIYLSIYIYYTYISHLEGCKAHVEPGAVAEPPQVVGDESKEGAGGAGSAVQVAQVLVGRAVAELLNARAEELEAARVDEQVAKARHGRDLEATHGMQDDSAHHSHHRVRLHQRKSSSHGHRCTTVITIASHIGVRVGDASHSHGDDTRGESY